MISIRALIYKEKLLIAQDKRQENRNEVSRASLQELQTILKAQKGRRYSLREAAEVGRGLVQIFNLFVEIEDARQNSRNGHKIE